MPDTAARRSGPGSVVVAETGEARCAMAWISNVGRSGQYWFTDMFIGVVGVVGGVNDPGARKHKLSTARSNAPFNPISGTSTTSSLSPSWYGLRVRSNVWTRAGVRVRTVPRTAKPARRKAAAVCVAM